MLALCSRSSQRHWLASPQRVRKSVTPGFAGSHGIESRLRRFRGREPPAVIGIHRTEGSSGLRPSGSSWRYGRHELTNLLLTRAQVDELVERMLKSSGLDLP